MKLLNDNQKLKLRKAWHALVIDRAGRACEECGLSTEPDDGKLTGDQIKTQGSRPDLRFDVANGRCLCLICHNKRHTGEIKLGKKTEGDRTKKFKNPSICKVGGCPIFATGCGRKPDHCFKHQK